MKNRLSLTAARLLTAALLSLIPAPASAAAPVENYAQISQPISADGVILFVYGKGWDAKGEQLCRSLAANAAVQQAAGHAALMLAPTLQYPTEEQTEQQKQQLGALSLPDDGANDSYPALLFFDNENRCYSLLCGAELMDNPAPDAVAAAITARLNALHQRTALLAAADGLAGEARALKLLEAARVEGITMSNDALREQIKAADPEDQSRALWALNFDNGSLTDEEKKNLSLEDVCARVDAYLNDPLLTVNQKQRACAYVVGHIHRTTGNSRSDLMVRYARRMHELAPDTVLGRSALIVIRDWATGDR